MKRKILPVTFLMLNFAMYAQVGVGTKNPHTSSILELNSPNRGLLIPQIPLQSLTDSEVIEGGQPKIGLLVFNTTNIGSILTPGYYYWGKRIINAIEVEGWIRLGDENFDLDTHTNESLSVDNNEILQLVDSNGKMVSIPLIDLQLPSSILPHKTERGVFVFENELKRTYEIRLIEEVINNIEDIFNKNSVINYLVNQLKGRFGNVVYEDNKFYYLDEKGQKQEIDWKDLNTKNVSFLLINDKLSITDTDGFSVELPIEEIAKNDKFIKELISNSTFVSELTSNTTFIEQLSKREEFITNIINQLKGDFGNVIFEDNKFYYIDGDGKKQEIDWSAYNTTNVSFTLGDVNGISSLIITDSDKGTVTLPVKSIATNTDFITYLTENKEFVTNLVENKNFIDQLSKKEEFITNIINQLKGDYGNVFFENNKFYYLDGNGNKYEIDWSKYDTTNVKFSLVKEGEVEYLVVEDSQRGTVKLDVKDIASSKNFVTELVKNDTFITELTENKNFIEQLSKKEEFITNIIKQLKGDYGNVFFEGDKFYYLDGDGKKQEIDWSAYNTTNVSFTLGDVNGISSLIITDSAKGTVTLPVKLIATNTDFITYLTENKEFVTNLVENKNFIDQLSKKEEFITNIINQLKGDYGNVFFEGDKFYYLDDKGNKQEVDWSKYDTTNVKFSLVKEGEVEYLVVEDSQKGTVKLDVKDIASSKNFVTELVKNDTFITELTENKNFIDQLSKKEEFITNIINQLKGDYGNVFFEGDKFYYLDDKGNKQEVDWSKYDTTNVKFSLVKEGEVEFLVVEDSQKGIVKLDVKDIASSKNFVTELVKNDTFITELTENKNFIDQLSKKEEFITNIINQLKGDYGNVFFEGDKFYYLDDKGNKQEVDWSKYDTTNVKFSLVKEGEVEYLVVEDSQKGTVKLDVKDIASSKNFVTELVKNDTFITELTENKNFIDQLSKKEEFITNIINQLKGDYGNVFFEGDKFYYLDDKGNKQEVDWSKYDTTNVKFSLIKEGEVEYLVVEDSQKGTVKLDVKDIASSKNFVTELVKNDTFITELTENKNFIDQLSKKEEFITNIINQLKGDYGNVFFEGDKFYYLDDKGNKQEVDWSKYDTTNVKFSLIKEGEVEYLVVEDSQKGTVKLDVKDIASSKNFVTELVKNDTFITELTENKNFIDQLSKKEEFITNIINQLKGDYGNVFFEGDKFYYLDDKGNKQEVDWSKYDTTNVKFSLIKEGEVEYLVVEDSQKGTVKLDVKDIASSKNFVTELVKNDTFITELTENKNFIDQLSKKEEFITNIINQLKGDYGNVFFEGDKFYYLDDKGNKQEVDWSKYDTTNVKFSLVKEGEVEYLVVEDSQKGTVKLDVKDIASSKNFVTELVKNDTFITELTENKNFIEQLSKKEEFITNIINQLKGDYGNVFFEGDKFYYLDDKGNKQEVDWSKYDTTNVKFSLVKEGEVEYLVVEDSQKGTVKLDVKDIASSKNFVTELVKNDTFITELIGNDTFITNLNSKQLFASLESKGNGVYIFNSGEKDAKNVIIEVNEDVKNYFKNPTYNKEIKEFLAQYLTTVEGSVYYDGDTFTYVNNEGNKIDLKLPDYIKANQAYASLTNETTNAAGVKAGFTFNDGKTGSADVNFAETLTATNRYKSDGIVENVTAAPTAGLTYYEYVDESGAKRYITVSQDVSNDFSKIVENNKLVIENIVKEVSGDVKVINKNGDVIFVIKKEDGTTENINITELIQSNSFLAKLTNETTNAAGVKAGFTFNDGKTGSADVRFAETLTATNRYKSDGIVENVTAVPTAGLTYYEYVDESGAKRYITVSQDVSNDFSKIIENNKSILEQFITNATGEVSISKDAVGNVTINYANGGTVNLTSEIARVQKYTTVTEVAKTATEGKGLTIDTQESGKAAVTFKETLTATNRFKSDGVVENVSAAPTAGLTYYEYIDELGVKRYITVSQDVSNDFSKIVENNKLVIENIVKEVSGDVKVINKDGDVIFVIKKEDGTTENINITELIQSNSFLAKLTNETTNAAGVKAGFTFNDGKTGSADVKFAETLTSLTRAANDKNHIEYNYTDETEKVASTKITVTQDVINSFPEIVKEDKVITEIEKIVVGKSKNPWLNMGTEVIATEDIAPISHRGSVTIGGNTLLNNSKATNVKLSVEGDIVASGKFFSTNSVYADYVFEKYFTGSSDLNLTYEFKSLDYVKDFVEKYNHLPGVTKISEVERSADGKYLIDFTELSIQQLEKIEELYLHTIEQQQALDKMQSEMDAMKSRLEALELIFNNK